MWKIISNAELAKKKIWTTIILLWEKILRVKKLILNIQNMD